jgi:hypothetical protein
MTGIGLFLGAISYAIIYWGVQAVQGNHQGTFMSYVFPFSQ